MKEIKLLIADDVYARLVSASFTRKLAGTSHGVVDEAINKILKNIEDGDKEVTLQYKEKNK